MEFLTNRNTSAAAALGLSALLVAGCGEPAAELTYGVPATVTQHVYHEPYYSLLPAGKVLVPVYHQERYELDVRQCGHDNQAGATENGCALLEVDVSRQTYQQYPDGVQIIFSAPTEGK